MIMCVYARPHHGIVPPAVFVCTDQIWHSALRIRLVIGLVSAGLFSNYGPSLSLKQATIRFFSFTCWASWSLGLLVTCSMLYDMPGHLQCHVGPVLGQRQVGAA